MKIVIEIPNYTKEQIDDGKGEELGIPLWLCYGIADGKPLPKGHGKIVDIKPLMVGLYEGMGYETFTPIEVYKMLDECKVIIEADKEGAEDGKND